MLNRILRAESVRIVVGIVEQRIDRLIAVQIDDAKILPTVDLVNPRIARENDMAVDRFRRAQLAFDEILAMLIVAPS